MADEADIAADYEQRAREEAIARARDGMPSGKGPLYCVGLPGHFCANEIPAERREHGYVLCVECQRVREARG